MRTLATALALTITAATPLPAAAATTRPNPPTTAVAKAAEPRPAKAAQELRYVALGDSFTAGPLIPAQRGLPGCLRSDHDYPSLVAASLKARLTDVSCSGAETTHMTHPQVTTLGVNPAQLDSVTSSTDLVTLGIGGNDVGFGKIALTCATASLTAPSGAPCAALYKKTLDKRIQATAPKVAAVLRRIHAKAPHARVLLVGYLRLLPDAVGCWPSVPVATGDVPFLNTTERHLNTMLATTAAANGATFVDTYAGSKGHDVCAPPANRWVEGVLPSHPAAPYHPNQTGMQATATRVLSALGKIKNT
ncbi:SGNH/GDSL hydrolase family protein [Actinomadura rupiterrae]|uniref:SGNH/GDSL hydrolase family protein n=1 Tax=Actinomadura rupiterrae TaxID=559627 RepID=UPI0020A5697F|nr:SGNH/GDSL hydrolase family protein [Actinomadura rupiterrae]MCP2343509.1 lysophospholipase L1-like esterase [Actinomadura rupiterrae]